MLCLTIICRSGGAEYAVGLRLGGVIRRGHLGLDTRAIEGHIRGGDLPEAWGLDAAFGGLDCVGLGGLIYFDLFIQFEPC